ncbi:alanine racemase [Acidiferrimicrobium sp. IK]|uniref:alanine racemase n=1 Tax=Acidiferrimicrobium sp. IK TaxID=2871700 RepID=UPI0021CB7396|nr:alanine racemase [Acidiferrimicrobium sp. IK]MCU4184986.1 alanine racemase [Acidiferrimicrobium sp. IK]
MSNPARPQARAAAAAPELPLAGGDDQPGARVEAGRLRPAWAEVDLAAVRHNASLLAGVAAPGALCAVVKAWGYGHGSVPVARAALEGGAQWLAVALVEEGRQLRDGGIDAPVLLLSEPAPAAMQEVVASRLTPTIYTDAGLAAVSAAARAAGEVVDVQVKVDTGMHRVGAAPERAVAAALEVERRPELRLQGFWTHLAVADEVDDPYTGAQLDVFAAAVDDLARHGLRPPLLHAANSAGAMWHPRARYDMVRCGIALYGLSPAGQEAAREPVPQLRPALALVARVSHVKEVAAGERLSYGLRYRLDASSVVATVPLGYADGVTRSLSSAGGQVLVGGTRRPIAGTVTMDQILVDCGPGSDVSVGDEVVLIGTQGGETIGAWEWAERTGTIAYEVVCGVSGRVPRAYRNP